MKFSKHIRLGAKIGLYVGIFISLMDILSRILVWSFEWFEFYILIFVTTVLITLFFTLLSGVFGILDAVIRKRISIKTWKKLYLGSVLMLLFIFYGYTLVRFYIVPLLFNMRIGLVQSLTYVVPVGMLLFFIILLKGDTVVKFFSGFNRDHNKLLSNIVFLIAVFVFFSFIMDLQDQLSIPAHNKEKIEQGPNIILISMDTVRADHLSVYGYEKETTPNIDALAKNSAVFLNHESVTSWTLPSHASMFSGVYSHVHGATIQNQIVSQDEVFITENLPKDYVKAGFVSYSWLMARHGFNQGYDYYFDRLDFFEYLHAYQNFNVRRLIRHLLPKLHTGIFGADGTNTAEEINKKVFSWLDKNNDQKFFLFLHYFDAHSPYTMGEEYRAEFYEGEIDLGKVRFPAERYGEVNQDHIEQVVAAYDAEIKYLDHHLGELFDKLDSLGLMNNTVIIITADHGEEFYDHGGFGHTKTLYEEVVNVPLIIYYPEIISPNQIEERVSMVDIPSTILDIVDVDTPEHYQGESLLPIIQGEKRTDSLIFSEVYGRDAYQENTQRAVYQDDYKLISVSQGYGDINSALFDLEQDPEEQINLLDQGSKKRAELLQFIEQMSLHPSLVVPE